MLFGISERWQDRETGTFFCPGCGSERSYRHRRARNWFHLLIPLIPRDVTGDVYLCQTCHRSYDEHVITSPPSSDLATRLQRVTRTASVLAVLDGDPYDEPSRKAAVRVIRGAGLPTYSTVDLDADLRSIDVNNLGAEAKQLTLDMDQVACERLVYDVGHVAVATGSLSETNRSMLDELGRALTLTPGMVHRVLSRLDQEASNIAAFADHSGTQDPR